MTVPADKTRIIITVTKDTEQKIDGVIAKINSVNVIGKVRRSDIVNAALEEYLGRNEFIQQQYEDIMASIHTSTRSVLEGRTVQLLQFARYAGDKELETKIADLYIKIASMGGVEY